MTSLNISNNMKLWPILISGNKLLYYILLYHDIDLDIYYFDLSRDDAPAYNSITNYDVDMDKSHQTFSIHRHEEGKRGKCKMTNKRKNLIDSKFLTFLPPPSLKKKVEHTFQQQQPLVIKSGQRTFNGTLINLTCLER